MRATEAIEFLRVSSSELAERKAGFTHLTLTARLWDARRQLLLDRGKTQLAMSFMDEVYE